MFSFTMNENSRRSAADCAAAASARSFNVISILADVRVLASVFAVLCGLIIISISIMSAALAIISALLLGLIICLIIIAGVPLSHMERTAPL